MNNADLPAMPTSPNESDPQWAAARIGGLTKREQFAMAAMQGLLASDTIATYEEFVEGAITCADALLAALEKPVG